MAITMTLTDTDWTEAEMAAGWADDGTAAEVAALCAESEIAYLVNNTHKTMPGWTFSKGTFSGPSRKNAADDALGMIVEAVDYVVEHLDEIAAEVSEAA